MRSWSWNRSLSLADPSLFFVFFVAVAVFGFSGLDEDQSDHGVSPPVPGWRGPQV